MHVRSESAVALGVHALVSAERGKGKRKRWYARVAVHEDARVIVLNPRDVDTMIARASGPGGQNVNKRSTAVRLRHRPTGIMVVSSDERSQKANLKAGFSRLARKLAERDQIACMQVQAAVQGVHDRVRDVPVAVYRRGGRRGRQLLRVERSR